MLFFLTLLGLTRGYFRRRYEQSDVWRTFFHSHGLTTDIERFLEARSTQGVTDVCNEIMEHVSGTHRSSLMTLLFSSATEEDVMTDVGGETSSWVAEQVPSRRRLAQEQTWNVTRRMAVDTWSQSLGYVVP